MPSTKAYSREYRQKNKDKINAYNRKYRQKNKDKILSANIIAVFGLMGNKNVRTICKTGGCNRGTYANNGICTWCNELALIPSRIKK